MLIKLTEGTDNEVLYVNHSAVSGPLPAESYMKEITGRIPASTSPEKFSRFTSRKP